MKENGMALSGTEGQDRKSYSDVQDRESYAQEDETEDWRERHGVNCYFCGKEFDERDGVSADSMNGGDGGTACEGCAREREGNERA